MSSRDFDAIVIGGGIGSLVAAAYLSRAGLKTVLLEATERLGGRAQNVALTQSVSAPLVADTAYALDTTTLHDLRLMESGLAFAERDMRLVSLRPAGRHLVLPRPASASASPVQGESIADLRALGRYRNAVLGFARRLRPLWTPANLSEALTGEVTLDRLAAALRFSTAEADRLDLFLRSSANAYLDRWFETDALKATLAADACIDGLSPHEAGSALALLWRGAQTGCGRQAAVCQIAGGPARLVEILASTAHRSGAQLRSSARVSEILIDGGLPQGVRLATGDTITASRVISGLGRRRTLGELLPPEVLPISAAARLPGAPRTASARLLLALSGTPPFAGLSLHDLRARLLVAPRPESAAEAKGAALVGELPRELVLEMTVPTFADASLDGPGHHALCVRIPHVPYTPAGGWLKQRDVLKKRVLTTIESYAPGLSDRIVQAMLLTPEDLQVLFGAGDAGPTIGRLLAPYATRIGTPVPNLYLCGSDAEPFDVLSGRAGRLAAAMARTEGAA